jgi:hypothetical protein
VSWSCPNLEAQTQGSVKAYGIFQAFGTTKLVKLSDISEFEPENEVRILPAHRWFGAVYRSIYSIPGHDFLYLVFGENPLDAYRMLYVFDIVDVRDHQLQFGHPIFENQDSTISVRKIYEVARGANFTPQIHPQAERLVIDHLKTIPYNPNTSTMVNVPDGTYIFFDWEQGKYRYNDRLFSDDQDRVIRNPKIRKEAAKRDLFGNPQPN